MEESQKMEQQIWEYIDGICSAEDSGVINQLIKNNEQWSEKYNELLSINSLLKENDLEMPSMRFTKNVMEEIAQYHIAPATKSYIDKKIIRGLTIFFLLMISGLMVYLFGQVHWTGTYSGNITPDLKIDVSKMHLNRVANNYYTNIFIGINVILGLFIIDRYFEQRKKHKQEGQWSKGDTA